MPQPRYYNAFARWLHWVIAIGIGLAYVLAEQAEEAYEAGNRAATIAFVANHKSLGITLLGLTVLRLLWRGASQQPMLPNSMPAWQILVAKLNHYLLYVLLIGMPVTGWLGSSSSAYSVSWFNLVTLPDLVPPSEQAKDMYFQWHHAMWTALLVLLALHLLAVIKHAFSEEGGVLGAMWSGKSVLAAILAFPLGWLAIDAVSHYLPEPHSEAAFQNRAEALNTHRTDSSLKPWAIDYANSQVVFTGEQAGAAFKGEFSRWRAEIRLEPEALAESVFDVTIDLASVATRDTERDSTLLSAEFFDVQTFPQAQFQAFRFSRQNDVYTADGVLALKGVSLPLVFYFKLADTADLRLLVGRARINRLAWQIGTGEWEDTATIGQFVDVAVTLSASK